MMTTYGSTLRESVNVWWHIHVRYHVRKDHLLLGVANAMPRWLVKWCTIRLGAHATTGKHGGTHVPDLTLMDALRRWDE